MRSGTGELQRGKVRSALDWDRIEAWTQQLVAGDLSQINTVFAANAAMAPRIQWCPARDQISTVQIRLLLDYWSDLKGQSDLPRIDGVDLRRLAPIQQYVALVDVLKDGHDFRYRRANPTIASLLGYDVRGMRVSEVSQPPFYLESVIALYRAAYRRGEPVYIERPAKPTIYGSHYAVLPLTDEGGKVATFLVGLVPLGTAGLPIIVDL